jgi:hypothetical protein
VIAYFEAMKEGTQRLGESFNEFSSVDGSNRGGNVQQAIDAAERGIRTINTAPRIDAQSEQYSARLLELLTRQKNTLTDFQKSGSKAREGLRQQEVELTGQAEQFLRDYQKWLPGFLKDHGYELQETGNH